jgi:hypothetical protein
MQLPKELNELRKMKLAYNVQRMIAACFALLTFAFLALSVCFSKSYIIETLLCVAIANIIGSNASQLQKSFFLFQKLKEVQDHISNVINCNQLGSN